MCACRLLLIQALLIVVSFAEKLTEAEKLLQSYEKSFFWTIITSADGTRIAPRACFLQYKSNFGFYICAKNHTNKYQQLKANPFVTLSLAEVKDHNIPVFFATCRVSTDKADIDKAWFNQMKEFGYSGPDDPRLVVFIFTIHGATLGKTKYEGVPYDLKSLKVVGDVPPPALPEGPYKSVEGLAILKEAFNKNASSFHLFTYGGLKIHDRLMQLNYKEKVGYYFVTSASSDKVAQLTGNPNIALLQEQRPENKQIVVDGLLLKIGCNKSKEETWDEGYKAYGYTGYNDPNYAVYKLIVRKIVVHSFTPESPQTYQFEPTPYDQAILQLYEGWKTHAFWTLATVDERNVPHTRTMGLMYHSALGFLMGGRNTTDKFKQIAYKPSAALSLYLPATGEDYQVQVGTRVSNCDAVRYALWSDMMKTVGYTGPDDKAFVPFVFNIHSLTYRPNMTSAPTVIKVCKTPGTGAVVEEGNKKLSSDL